MSSGGNDSGVRGVTVSFGAHFAQSDQFDAIFKEGMALVEKTAAYLDGEGRTAAKGLQGPLSLVYATESMRLTTRLLELASWLLVRRALKDGEISETEAQQKRERIKLQPLGRPAHVKGFEELPAGFQALVLQSFALNDRILKLDAALNASVTDTQAATENPLVGQFAKLEAAFGGRRVARH